MITITYTTSNGYMIRTGLELKGRGIEKLDGDYYRVSEKAMIKLQNEYEWKAEF